MDFGEILKKIINDPLDYAFLAEVKEVLSQNQKSDLILDHPTRTLSAVLVLFQPGNTLINTRVLLSERAAHLATHASQVAFPGGTFESQDKDLLHTALRELHEELGLKLDEQDVQGKLPSLLTVTGNFKVTPYLGECPKLLLGNPPLKLSHEVAFAEWVGLGSLLNTKTTETYTAFGRTLESPVFTWESAQGPKRIWGVTAWILDLIFKRYDRLLP